MKKLIIGIAVVAITGLGIYCLIDKEPVEESQKDVILQGGTHTVDINFFASSGATTTPLGDIATTTSATSTNTGAITNIANAKKVTFYFQRTGIYGNEGTSTFSVEVTRNASTTDDNNWIDYNRLLDNVTNANSEELTRVSEVALTGTTTAIYSMDLSQEVIESVRCIVEEATDGEHICLGKILY